MNNFTLLKSLKFLKYPRFAQSGRINFSGNFRSNRFLKMRRIYSNRNYCLLFAISLISLLKISQANAQQSLYVGTGGTFYTHPGSQMAIFGNIINDAAGGLNHNNGGDVILFRSASTGTGNSRIYDGPSAPAFTGNYNSNGAYTRFYNLNTDNSTGSNTPSGTLINATSGTGQISVEQEIRITNLHTFTNGMIWTPRGNWRHAFVHYDGNGSSYTGNSDVRHIDGYAAKTGNSNFDFPIGDGIHERISGIYNPSAGIFKSAYFKKDPQAGTTGISGSSPSTGPFMGGLINSSSREFWDIDGTASSQYKLTSLNNVSGYSDWSNNFSSYTASDIAITAWDGNWEYLNINVIPASFSDDGGFITAVATNPDNGNVPFSGNPFSAYSWGLKGGVLPLRLISFNSRANGCTVQLNWNTSNEVNTSRFMVEQSANGISFTKAAEVGAKGSMIINNYSVELNQPEGLNYYRIKMIDLDGKYSYSMVINAKTDCGAAGNYFSVYPNPVTNGMAVIKLITEYKGNATLTMINANGQEVFKKDMNVTAGMNTVSLGLQHFPKGHYVVSFFSEDGQSISETRKIIIK